MWAYIFVNKKKKKKKKRQVFALFLKAFSWETDLSVTLGDFTVKKIKQNETKQKQNKKTHTHTQLGREIGI